MYSHKLTVIWVALLAAVVGTYMFMLMRGPSAEDVDLAREKPSAAGLYRVAVGPELEPVEQGRLHSWIVTVQAGGAPVTDAVLTVDGGMPQHGHGLPTQPQSAGHIGEGRYRIEGVRFNMAGWWVLKIGIESAAGKDAAEFNIML